MSSRSRAFSSCSAKPNLQSDKLHSFTSVKISAVDGLSWELLEAELPAPKASHWGRHWAGIMYFAQSVQLWLPNCQESTVSTGCCAMNDWYIMVRTYKHVHAATSSCCDQFLLERSFPDKRLVLSLWLGTTIQYGLTMNIWILQCFNFKAS